MDIVMIAASSKITHMLIGGKNYKTYEDLRGSTVRRFDSDFRDCICS